jgi:hypothetical protein
MGTFGAEHSLSVSSVKKLPGARINFTPNAREIPRRCARWAEEFAQNLTPLFPGASAFTDSAHAAESL